MKYLLLSVIVAALALPLLFGTDPSPRRGLRRAILAVALFNTLYLLALWLTHAPPDEDDTLKETRAVLGTSAEGQP